MVVGAGGVGLDKSIELLVAVGAEQIAKEEQAPSLQNAHRFAKHTDGLGNVMNDAVGYDDVEQRVGKRQPLGIDVSELNSLAEAVDFDVVRSEERRVGKE